MTATIPPVTVQPPVRHGVDRTQCSAPTTHITNPPTGTGACYICVPAPPPVHFLTPVIDCPECVWNDFGATGLDMDFQREWSHALHAAGAEAVQEHLILAWRKRGYSAELVCHHQHARVADPDVPVEVLHLVWQETVDAVEGEELLARADLVDEYQQWMEKR